MGFWRFGGKGNALVSFLLAFFFPLFFLLGSLPIEEREMERRREREGEAWFSLLNVL